MSFTVYASANFKVSLDSFPQDSGKSNNELRQEYSDSVFMSKYKPTRLRSPLISFCLSLVIPGAGQLYNKQYGKAGFYCISEGLLAGELGNVIYNRSDAGLAVGALAVIIGGSFYLVQVIDAPVTSSYINYLLNNKNSMKRISFRFEPVLFNNPIPGDLAISVFGGINFSPGIKLVMAW